jgi:hypothetical protein
MDGVTGRQICTPARNRFPGFPDSILVCILTERAAERGIMKEISTL